MKIYKQINAVMNDLGAIAKDRKNTHQGYAFRGIEDFYNSIHPELSAKGVFIVTQVIDKVSETHQKGDKTSFRVMLNVNHKFYADDGSFVEVITAGEGVDTSDKATSKAMSMAMKYAFIQTFSIPTTDISDPERDSPSVDSTNPKEEKPQAAKTVKPVVKSIAQAKPAQSFEEFEKEQDSYRVTFGVYKDKTLDQIGEKTAKGYAQHLANDALKRGGDMKPEEGRFIQEVKAKYKSVTS
jgi:hypothetical protein